MATTATRRSASACTDFADGGAGADGPSTGHGCETYNNR